MTEKVTPQYVVENAERFAGYARTLEYELTPSEARVLVEALLWAVGGSEQITEWDTLPPPTSVKPETGLEMLTDGMENCRTDIQAIVEKLDTFEQMVSSDIGDIHARLDAQRVALDAVKPSGAGPRGWRGENPEPTRNGGEW